MRKFWYATLIGMIAALLISLVTIGASPLVGMLP